MAEKKAMATAGPHFMWKNANGDWGVHSHHQDSDFVPARLATVHDPRPYKGTAEGNARLFAASFDLLAACKALVTALRESSSDRGLIAQHGDALDAGLLAIKKAEATP